MDQDSGQDWLAWAALACGLQGLRPGQQDLQAVARTLARLSAAMAGLAPQEAFHG